VAQQTVEEGYIDGSMAVITKGLKGGEQVVTSGQSRLAPGARVAIQDARPATDAETKPAADPATAG
jgi:multidrug efflux pump subunit AcrA (membrane-fusion protein)